MILHLLRGDVLFWANVFWPTVPMWAEAPAILLANIYREQVDLFRYLVGEKLDGVRASWDGKSLRFRRGNEVCSPRWFIGGLPKQPLDGDIRLEGRCFQRLSDDVGKYVPEDTERRQVRYMIFEFPDAPGNLVSEPKQSGKS